MRRLFAFFARRWFVSLLGVAALAALIWYVGPLIEIDNHAVLASPTTRRVAILVLVALWALNMLRKLLTARFTNAQLIEELVGATRKEVPAGPADEEIATLQRRLDEALGTLKKVRLGTGHGRQYLYQLPWYVIIGPPGSGKTTALLNSGLRFPLADEFGTDDIRGVGGTRNCDWFFTDEAILLDTAGRYATQDSDAQVDSAAWLGFLGLLKKYRKRRPINGVLIAVSVPELLELGQSGRSHHARVIRQRVQELHTQFNIRFPIYVLLTKCDLLPGFVEFFDDLDETERGQAWGVTFPEECVDNSKNVIDRLDGELDALEQQLHASALDRMHRETSIQRRALIFAFPQQFAALKPVVDGFLENVFRSTRYEEDALLRGVYFVSGTQEGTPIDRLLGSLSETFGVERSAASRAQDTGRSYFITRLLRDVVFQEAGLAGTNLRFERRRRLFQYGAYAGLLAALGLGAVVWFTSYTRNVAYVTAVENASVSADILVDELAPTQTDILDALPALNGIHDIPGGYAERGQGTPILMGLGLGQRRKLGSEAQETYRRVLVRQFLPRVLLNLEARLRNATASFDERYEILKAYLMFKDHEHYQREVVTELLDFVWEDSLRHQVTEEVAKDVAEHRNALLDILEAKSTQVSVKLDDALVKQVRAELSRVSLSEQAYGRIKRSPAVRKLEPFNTLGVAGADAPLALRRLSGKPMSEGIPGFFTKNGYRVFLTSSLQIASHLSAEQWVLGEFARRGGLTDRGALVDEVGRLYATEYVSQWRSLLQDIEISEFSNVTRAVQLLNLLSNPASSPIVRLLKGVEQETSLSFSLGKKVEKESGVFDAAKVAAEEVIKILRSDKSGSQATSLGAKTPAAIIEEAFARLIAEVQTQEGSPAPLDRSVGLLNELWVQMNSVASARGGELIKVARGQVAEIIGRIDLEAERQPQPIGRWLKSIADNARRVSLGDVTSEFNAVWRATGDSLCRTAISGRYPLARDANEEVALDDFPRFFGPGGIMDTFFKEYLQPFVETTQASWRMSSDTGGGPSISATALAQFQHADVIRRTFFPRGSSVPSIEFELAPITMDADITHFVLNLEGQMVSYRHTPEPPAQLKWPGPGPHQVRIQLSPPSEAGPSALTWEGAWAWFRILDQADVTATQVPEHFNVTFDVGGRRVSYELRARSVLNPFRFSSLGQFRCPSGF